MRSREIDTMPILTAFNCNDLGDFFGDQVHVFFKPQMDGETNGNDLNPGDSFRWKIINNAWFEPIEPSIPGVLIFQNTLSPPCKKKRTLESPSAHQHRTHEMIDYHLC